MYAVLIGHLCVMDKRGSAIVTHEKWGGRATLLLPIIHFEMGGSRVV